LANRRRVSPTNVRQMRNASHRPHFIKHMHHRAIGTVSPFPITLTTHLRFKARSTKQLTFGEPAPSVCRHPVSGLFHSPRRGAFHLSLTVLVRYRSHTST